jgi:hypothetical protein
MKCVTYRTCPYNPRAIGYKDCPRANRCAVHVLAKKAREEAKAKAKEQAKLTTA